MGVWQKIGIAILAGIVVGVISALEQIPFSWAHILRRRSSLRIRLG